MLVTEHQRKEKILLANMQESQFKIHEQGNQIKRLDEIMETKQKNEQENLQLNEKEFEQIMSVHQQKENYLQ